MMKVVATDSGEKESPFEAATCRFEIICFRPPDPPCRDVALAKSESSFPKPFQIRACGLLTQPANRDIKKCFGELEKRT